MDRVAEVMEVRVVDILMGMMTVKVAIQLDTQELETILQSTPMGMTILGLGLKSKFA